MFKGISRMINKRKIYRYIRYITLFFNRKKIIAHSRKARNIHLNVICLGTGNIEHYYHFLFDLLLPLTIILKRASKHTTFAIKDFGILTKLLPDIVDERVKIVKEGEDFSGLKQDLIGMNPRIVYISFGQLQRFKSHVFNALNSTTYPAPNKVLLIERLPPDDFYLTEASNKGAGTSRRSIINHEQLRNAVEAKVKHPYEFHNLQLEKLSLKDQIDYFRSAIVVIGQHGAGLANLVWTNKECCIIEFRTKKLDYFEILSQANKNRYFSLEYNEDHIQINCNEFISWLATQKELKSIFNS